MDKSFIDLFEEQVLKTPDNTAVVFEGEELSYSALNGQANRLANYLRNKGVQAETLVPLYIERGIDMMVGMLGIMKAGGAYVPIDTDFPEERISYMLQDTAASIIVTSNNSRSKLPATNIEVISIECVKNQPIDELPEKVLPNNLAYVIYTSGSTGAPKGVMIEHRNLVDYTNGLIDKTGISECKSFALVSTIATDLGNTVIYSALATGGALHLFTKESVSNIEYLHRYFATHKIDCLKIVPSHWKVLNMQNELLLPEKLIIFGGEALPEKVVEDIRAVGTQCRIVNHYGPTETTIGKLLHIVEPDARYEYTVPIGKPFSNTKVLVLTKNLKLCPIGVPGQLYITGDGVARGYLNNPELTKEKFIPNPFSKSGYSVMYGTGDLVKYLPDGNISFIGRVDNQVKIRGYRIELGEIENILHQCNLVSQVVVLAREDKQGNKQLVGYIVPEGDYDRDSILSYLKQKLPDYMIPAVMMELESFPLTANGKIDRNALPDPDAGELLSNQYVAPASDAEAKMATIWQDVLEEDRVGINDDFFVLGGHSLLAVRLVSAIRKAFVVEMPISDIFDYPTVRLLAAQVQQLSETILLTPIKPEPRPSNIPLSFSQERLWFIDRLEGSVQYHRPAIIKLKGILNNQALNQAFGSVVSRHEILRTVYIESEGQALQVIKEEGEFVLQYIEGASYLNNQQGLQLQIEQLIKAPFNLAADDMMRAAVINLSAEEHILVITMHHIASDGWSTSIFVKEILELYAASVENRPPDLLPLPIQYADFSIWQRSQLQGDVLQKKIEYWKNKLQGAEPLELPTDHIRPAIQSRRGAVVSFKIDKDLSGKLQELSSQQNATIFMTLLAAFKVLLYRYSGQEDIIVGTPNAGRQHQELEGLIGFFINTLVLRNEVKGDHSFVELLRQVKGTMMGAYENQEVPFEKVVDVVGQPRDRSRNPLFQVMFILQNTPEVPELRLGEIQLSVEGSYKHTTSLFDLTFTIMETPNGLQGAVEYCTALYNEQTVLQMTAHFKELLASIVAHPQQKIGGLQMLEKVEQNHLLFDFNKNVIYPDNFNIIDLFEQQVAKTPAATAIIFEDRKLSYFELNERANQFAHYLLMKGLKKQQLVPICMDRSLQMIVGIWGILKAGGAYVPIDPAYPQERMEFILKDTASTLVVTDSQGILLPALKDNKDNVCIECDWLLIADQPGSKAPRNITGDDLCYVIYTSGSTGKPKGVMIMHKGLAASTLSRRDQYQNMGSVFMVPSFAFDSSVAVIFGTHITGGTIVLCKNLEVKDADVVKRLLTQTQTILCVPSYYRFLLDEGLVQNSSLCNVILAGEKLEEQLVSQHYKQTKNIALYNEYGPTEGTVWATVASITEDSSLVTIGTPVNSVFVYILDNNLQLVPTGVTGEICVGGVQVAKGYLNLPSLTEEKFIANPFSQTEGERMYKTGDLGRWLPGGKIEYLLRKDDQVKINGYRIELGEIESVLQHSGLVSEAVILVKSDVAGNKRLVGYVVPKEFFEKDIIRLYLKARLPEYMVPTSWVVLEALPLTHNGKIDKKALPEPTLNDLSNEYIAPTNELETKLANIWSEILQIDQVGVNDNFFELGGHSLLAIRLVSAIRGKLDLTLTINDIFIYPTIAAFANNVIEKVINPSLPQVNIKYLVTIKPGGNKVPIYIVCGAGGTSLRFRNFSEMMDEDQPVYILQPPIDIDTKNFPTSIEDIARVFIEEIFTMNPDGPYILAGHCVGGIIAFEMAKQLKVMNKSVHKLVMFDTIIRKFEKKEIAKFANLYNIPGFIKGIISKAILKVDFETFLLRKHTKKAIGYKMRAFKAFFNKKPKKKDTRLEEMNNIGLEIFDESSEVYRVASKNYKIIPYDGEILLFYAKERYYFTDVSNNIRFKKVNLNNDTKNLWREYSPMVEIHEVEGDHSDIFDTTHGSEFATLLQQEIDKPSMVN